MKYNILDVIPFADNDGIALATCDATKYVKDVFNVDFEASFKIFSNQGSKRICFSSGSYAASKNFKTVSELYDAFENMMNDYDIYLNGKKEESVENVSETLEQKKEDKVYMKSPNKGGRPKKIK